MFKKLSIKQMATMLYDDMAKDFNSFFNILGTIEKEWIWANSCINEYKYYLDDIRYEHDIYMGINKNKTFPSIEFFKQFRYPIHPQYAIDVISKKVNEIMIQKYGNPKNQTMLHCAIDCTRFAYDKRASQ